MLHLHHGACAESQQVVVVWVFQSNANRKALRNPDPSSMNVRHRGPSAADSARSSSSTPEPIPLNDRPDRCPAIDHRVDRGTISHPDRRQLELPEVRHGEPFFGIDESEERLRGNHYFPGRNRKTHDPSRRAAHEPEYPPTRVWQFPVRPVVPGPLLQPRPRCQRRAPLRPAARGPVRAK